MALAHSCAFIFVHEVNGLLNLCDGEEICYYDQVPLSLVATYSGVWIVADCEVFLLPQTCTGSNFMTFLFLRCL